MSQGAKSWRMAGCGCPHLTTCRHLVISVCFKDLRAQTNLKIKKSQYAKILEVDAQQEKKK